MTTNQMTASAEERKRHEDKNTPDFTDIDILVDLIEYYLNVLINTFPKNVSKVSI